MGADEAKFDALHWAARTLAWERRLRELEAGPEVAPTETVSAVDVEEEVPDQCVHGVGALHVHRVVGAG